MLHVFILIPFSEKQPFINLKPTEEIWLFFQVQVMLMSLAYWNSFSLLEYHPINQQGLLPPTNNQHICSAASPCWLCRGKVPKVDVKHVKCYLPHLLGHWIFMGLDTSVSLQPAVQRTRSSLCSHQTCLILRHATPSILRNPLSYEIFICFLIRWWFHPKLTIISCSNLHGVWGELCCSLFWGSLGRISEGTPQRGKGRSGESGYNPMFCSHAHLLPPYTSRDVLWPLQGSRSLFTLTHAFPLCSEETAPNSMCITRAFQEAPVAARPGLDWRDCCLAASASCGVGSDSLSMAAEIAVVVSLNIRFLC